MIRKTLIEELSAKVFDGYVRSLPFDQWYWPTLFPAKATATLNYTTLIGEKGAPVIADFVAFGATIPQKRRDVIDKMFGEITKIAISRKMDENDYNDYNQLRALSNSSIDDILQFVYDDVDFCYKGVMGRLEWTALQAVSTGKVKVDTSNSEGAITTNDVDFKHPDANKYKAQTATWNGNQSTATPLLDLWTMYKAAIDDGVTPARFLMRSNDFYDMIATDEVKNSLYPDAKNVVTMSVNAVNQYMDGLGMPPITIIDQSLTIEINGQRSSVNPWDNHSVALLPSTRLGQMLYAPIAEEGKVNDIYESKRRNVLLQKYATLDPFQELTKGLTNSFPKYPTVSEVYLLDVSDT
ncbi:MAG: major capsid protein [bacterium]